jgi:LmbE family N-acetylglucosaminyl deacetylase
MNVLVIGSHPDDYELGAGGTIKMHTNHGDSIYSIIMSNGEHIGNGKERKKEAIKSAEFLGIRKVFFLGFKDTKVPNGINAIRKIEKIIKKYDISRVYTHSFKDNHQDHRNTSRATLSASRNVKQILFYESPSSDVDFRPTFFVDITNFIQDKITALMLYKSLLKMKKRYLEIDAIKSNSMLRGYQSNLKFAESFEVFRFIE